jgi:hypothetical protein
MSPRNGDCGKLAAYSAKTAGSASGLSSGPDSTLRSRQASASLSPYHNYGGNQPVVERDLHAIVKQLS